MRKSGSRHGGGFTIFLDVKNVFHQCFKYTVRGMEGKKNHLISITMSNFRSISVPTSQRPSSSIGSGTRILIPIHLLRCERCLHSDWITENGHCLSGGSPQSDCSWLSRDIYDSIFYSISPMVEACLCEGFMTSFFRALTAVVYFGMSLQRAAPD